MICSGLARQYNGRAPRWQLSDVPRPRSRCDGDGGSRLLREALTIKQRTPGCRWPWECPEILLGICKSREAQKQRKVGKSLFLQPRPARSTRSPAGGDADERCERSGGSSEPQLRWLLSHERTKRLGKSDLRQPQLQDTQSDAWVSILSKARNRDSIAYVQSVNNSSV